MTFYIGQKGAGEIFLGKKKIGRLYLGQTLVHTTKVASKPTFLEYVEFDGDSWVDTGYIPSSNTRVVGKVSFTKWHPTAGANYVFGVFGDGANFGLNVGSTRSIMNVPWGAQSGVAFNNSNVFGQVYSFDISKNGAYIDDVLKLTASQLSAKFTATKSLFVGWSNGTSTQKMIGKIYPIKIYENDVLMQDLRPALDPRGVVCFYDTVTKTYFYNQGTGELKAGEPLAEHEELEYLEFDGTQCVDTGLYPNSNMRVESTFMYEGHTEPDGGFIPSRGMYGAKGSGSYIALYSDGHQKWGGVNSVYMDVSVFKDKKVNAVQDKNGVVVDGVLYEYTSVPEDFVNTTNTFLIGDTNGSSARPFIGKMYGLKLYENNVLLRDFIPAKRSDGVKCMYDRVGNKYYELKGA